ncbi:MAG: YybH family protein [Planctomycetota bacterium]|jgi:uncharacterized protein (TIGR02246 family)
MKRRILLVVVLSVSPGVAAAQKSKPQNADETAIRKTVGSYSAAFNRHDAEGVAAHWWEDGEFLPPSGKHLKGRDAIQKEFEAFFKKTPNVRARVAVQSIRVTGPNQAVERGTVRVLRLDEPPSETSYIARHEKRDGVWKIKSIREMVPPPAAPSHYEQLKPLEWLIGEWVDRDEDSTIDTVCQWTKNRNFITRSFRVSIRGQLELEGTQVIGWDPANSQIRSWLFDSDGCFGQAAWRQKDERWVIQASRVLAGGEKASSVNVITRVDDDTFTWQSLNREVDGELLPNIEEVTVVRKPSAE